MSFNAQAMRPAVTQGVQTTETMEGEPIEINAPQVDARTISVAKTQTEEEGSGNSGSGQKNSQTEAQKQQAAVSEETIQKAMKELQKKNSNYISEFGIHEKTNRITVKIVDKKTKEVIKELPPEKTLDMIAKVWEYAGLFVDEKR
ncbi:MAG: flagellar protein FlaG [Lachnospiraceae bacterium]|nr:flagellar protein FlaG [Lachnospiraceae bacterium]MBR4207296.1 flagellar protein FlaG [Lachnospiraceae bacterium]MCR4938318.1 flagellar protein FlaG [Lachnospiraceae bacterium]